jgi:hypothetical protein
LSCSRHHTQPIKPASGIQPASPHHIHIYNMCLKEEEEEEEEEEE